MYKIFKSIIKIIWLIDILNIPFVIGGVNIASFLDYTLPLNFWFWLLLFLILPSSSSIEINGLTKVLKEFLDED